MTGSIPEPVLLVGPVTIDEIEGDRRPGGVVSYAAPVLTAFGIRARILTIAAPDTDLSSLEPHDVHLIEDSDTLTFAFKQTPEGRQLTTLARPSRPITAADLPDTWRSPATLILGTLIEDDIDLDSFQSIAHAATRTGLAVQGLQRHSTPVVHLGPIPDVSSLIRVCSPSTYLFRSAREASHWTQPQTAAVLATGASIVTTRGAYGAEVWRGNQRIEIPPISSGSEIDPTGAGDIFASAFILALDEGDAAAGQLAAAFAAASVERRGPGPLPSRAEIERRLAAARIVVDDGQRGASD